MAETDFFRMKENNRIITRIYASPCGTLKLGSFGDRLCLCDWQVERLRNHVDNRLRRLLDAEFVEGTSPVIEKAVVCLDEYFAGQRPEFDVPLPLLPMVSMTSTMVRGRSKADLSWGRGSSFLLFVGTDFQKKVWNALLSIPYGKTVSYGEMARMIGMPKAVRAVANANGANAISIFAPCHRVIGSDHTLTGYGGGLAAKEYLLRLEKEYVS